MGGCSAGQRCWRALRALASNCFTPSPVPSLSRHSVGRRVLPLQLAPEESIRSAQTALERIARSKLLQGCRVQSAVVAEKPAHEAIVRRAVATHADLIISGTRMRGFANRLVLRHTDWELIRHAPVPLLLVKSDRLSAKPVVLAAIDPLHANAKPARTGRPDSGAGEPHGDRSQGHSARCPRLHAAERHIGGRHRGARDLERDRSRRGLCAAGRTGIHPVRCGRLRFHRIGAICASAIRRRN